MSRYLGWSLPPTSGQRKGLARKGTSKPHLEQTCRIYIRQQHRRNATVLKKLKSPTAQNLFILSFWQKGFGPLNQGNFLIAVVLGAYAKIKHNNFHKNNKSLIMTTFSFSYVLFLRYRDRKLNLLFCFWGTEIELNLLFFVFTVRRQNSTVFFVFKVQR